MSFQQDYEKMIKAGTIQALVIVNINDGSIYWTSGNWELNGPQFLKAWAEKQPSVTVHGIKYSVIDITDDRLVATNVQGQGHAVAAKCPTQPYVFVAYSPSKVPVGDAYTGTAKLANSFK
ncbi:MAG: profilin family protein [Asgard group archaeon]